MVGGWIISQPPYAWYFKEGKRESHGRNTIPFRSFQGSMKDRYDFSASSSPHFLVFVGWVTKVDLGGSDDSDNTIDPGVALITQYFQVMDPTLVDIASRCNEPSTGCLFRLRSQAERGEIHTIVLSQLSHRLLGVVGATSQSSIGLR